MKSLMKNRVLKNSRRAMAIPVVLMVILGAMIMASSVFMFRKESKQQNITNFHFLRVNFLAQSAAQHVLLKLSCFPQDAYDAGVLGLGYCPFQGIVYSEDKEPTPGLVDATALKLFVEDCNTEEGSGIPWKIPAPRLDKSMTKYHVDALNVVSAYNDIAKRQTVLTAKIVAIGEGKMEKGNQEFRKERLEKVVQLTGNN